MPSTQTVSNVTDALLERVEPRVVQQLPKRMLLLQLAEKVAGKTMGGGRSYIVVIKTQFGESFRALRESEPVPDPSVGVHQRLQVATKLMASTFDITALAEAVSKGNENSLIDALADGTKDLTDAYRRNWSRSMYLLGDGAVARIAAGTVGAGGTAVDTTAKTIVLASPSTTNRWGGAYIREGMRLSFSANVTSTDFVTERNLDCEVTNVDRTVLTAVVLTVDQIPTNVDVVAADYIFIGGPKFTSKNREWNGLFSGLDDGTLVGTYLTKSRSGAGGFLWQAYVKGSIGSLPLERELILAATNSWVRSDEMFTHALSSPGSFNAYSMPFLAGRTWPQSGGSPMEVTAGFAQMPIMLQGKKVIWYIDPDCPKGSIFGFPSQFAQQVIVKAPGFWVGDNNKPVRSNSSLVSRFIFWGAGDFIIKRPNAGIRLDGITELPA